MALLLLVVGYLLGSIPSAVLVARLYGVDIRTVGTGVAGATNVKRHVGWPAAVIVGLVDLGKGAAAVLIALAWHPSALVAVLAALAALVGHSWPVWTRMHGGFAAAAAVGATAALLPLPTLLAAPFALAAIVIARRPAPAATALFVGALVFGTILGAEPVRIGGIALAGLFVLVRAKTWPIPPER